MSPDFGRERVPVSSATALGVDDPSVPSMTKDSQILDGVRFSGDEDSGMLIPRSVDNDP
jgi:hypothetical protein